MENSNKLVEEVVRNFVKFLSQMFVDAGEYIDHIVFMNTMTIILFVWIIGVTMSFAITSYEVTEYKRYKTELKIMYILAFILKNIFIWPWVIGRKVGKFLDRF